jgi:DNA-binding CsgD family transcriptional regulator
MEKDRLARLTEQQRICLRLVFAHMTSKEIAPLLGIEPNSVDQHIKAAMRVLGVADRRAAARLLAEHEGALGARPAAPASAGRAMREDQDGYEVLAPRPEPLLPLPIRGARPNDVGVLKRLMWIALIAIGAALAFGALAAGVEALTRLVRV